MLKWVKKFRLICRSIIANAKTIERNGDLVVMAMLSTECAVLTNDKINLSVYKNIDKNSRWIHDFYLGYWFPL